MWADNETSEDLLGFKVHADLLIDVINDEKILPVTIGVFGDWGSGKSSILKIINQELSSDDGELKDDTLVLYFNGWVFEGYDDAKAALLESIIKHFREHKSLGPKVENIASGLLKSVDWMRILGFGFKKIAIPAIMGYATGGASLVPYLAGEIAKVDGKKVGELFKGKGGEDFLKGVMKKRPKEDGVTLVRKFRDDFKKMIDDSEIKKLVVIIDDLDRCTPERIIENLEAIKLFINVEKTAFIIGADPRIVRHAIEIRYSQQGKVDGSDNIRIIDDYLEKLIQIPYNLPKLSDTEVETYISLLLCKKELSDGSFNSLIVKFQEFRVKDRYSVFGLAAIKAVIADVEWENLSKKLSSLSALVPVITHTLTGNPRQVKRFLNTFTLRQRLASVAKIADFNDGVLAKLMVLEYAELTLFKQLYDWQLNEKGLPSKLALLEVKANNADSFKEFLEESDGLLEIKDWTKEKIYNWLRVEPFLSNVDLSDYFWLSRDKIASTIPGTSLVPPFIRTIYNSLNQSSLPAAITKKLITEQVSILNTIETNQFLDYSSQMLKTNAKQKRPYEIFHAMIDGKITEAENYYIKTMSTLALKDIPASIGVSFNNYKTIPVVKEFIDTTLKNSDSPFAKSVKIN
jgi:hypothetical protein